MATTKGSAIAAPSIFGSDPIEQAFATGLVKSDAGESGALYALMSAARDRRGLATDQYRTDLRESNQLAALLERQGMQAEMDKEALKQLAPAANAMIQAADVPALGRMYSDPRSASAMAPADLNRAETRAKIAKLQAEATAKFGEGAPKVKTEHVVDSNGLGQTQLTITGGDPRLHPAIREWWLNTDKSSRTTGAGVRPGQPEARGGARDAVITRHPGAAQ